MKKIVRHLRNRSRESRKTILLFVTLGTFLALFLLWIILLGVRARNEREVREAKGESPFSIIGDRFGTVISDVKEK